MEDVTGVSAVPSAGTADLLTEVDGDASVSPDTELVMWRSRAKTAEAALAAREFDDALRRALCGMEFSSAAARRYVEERITEAGLTVCDGAIGGLDALMEEIRRDDPGVFADSGRARFTDVMSAPTEDGAPAKKARIMAIRDREARRAAIAANLGLFGK